MPAMPIPKPHTTLGSYADKMGINPMHFFGGFSRSVFHVSNSCGSVWQRHTWQNDDNVSHEDLAYQLLNAERTLKEFLGYPVYPEWLELNMVYPRPDQGYWMSNGAYKQLSTQVGHVWTGGSRAIAKVASALDVVYTDGDSDSYKETATIDISVDYDAAWFDDYGRILVVPEGYGTEFAIDYYVSLDANEIKARAWVMVNPELASSFPVDDRVQIDLDDPSSLVEKVDLYRVYNDPTVAVTFRWNDGTEQAGTLQVVDVNAGIVRPIPDTSTWCTGTTPERVKLNIYAGHEPSSYWTEGGDAEHTKIDPLFAEAIRMLATARLERDLCGCSNVLALGLDLRTDMALVSPQGNFLAVADVIQECPFGTRRGEWIAWNKVRNYQDKYISVALV